MIYLSAGHHNTDPGAISPDKRYKEADLTKELRDLVAGMLAAQGYQYILDKDYETLAQYLQRIKPGNGSVQLELHWNSSINLATGIEAFVQDGATNTEHAIAKDLCQAGVQACAFYNRGAKTESQSHRGRLALLHTKAGIKVLLEVCFINNPDDMRRYQNNKRTLARMIAEVLIKYENVNN